MAVDFDPNAAAERKKSQLWATYRADRRTGPKFKIHSGKGRAKQALDWCDWSPVAVYFRSSLDSKWEMVGELSRTAYDRTDPSWRQKMNADAKALKDKMDALA